jgi:aryl-alcohol dehydrogenase-like predicted oxidoreductase
MVYRSIDGKPWNWSSVGYGMWGLAGWTGNDDQLTFESLCLAVENGVNFFDTAWAYGNGKSEEILGRLIKQYPEKKLWAASKIPPKNRKWPASSGDSIQEVFPASYIREYTLLSLKNLGIEQLDLMQFHVWSDTWANQDEWKTEIEWLKKEGLVGSFGISVNRFEPNNVLETLKSGCIDCVQVVYNLFDQNPEDQLFPYCKANNIGIIARVPFDEGSLTGQITMDSRFPSEDWRSNYFSEENLKATLPRVEAIKKDLPNGMSLPELALRFVLQNDAVTTVIPGMRKKENVLANILAGDGNPLKPDLYDSLKKHRWERGPKQNPTS